MLTITRTRLLYIHGKLNKNCLTFVHIKQLDLTAFRIGSWKKCLRLSPIQFVQYSTPLLHKVTYQTYGDRLMSYQYRRYHHPNQLTVTLDRYHSLPLLSKILESFVGGWILNSVCNKLDKKQFGALKQRSTSHALISVLHHWQNALDSGNSVRSLFVDYTKPYDRVDQNILAP